MEQQVFKKPTLQESTAANKLAWEAVVVHHKKSQSERISQRILEKRFTDFLDDDSLLELQRIDVKGKRIIQLCCNNGRETLAILAMGASRAVGVDLTEGFILQGKEIAFEANLPLELICSSVYDLPESLNNSFDLVYISIGALGWLQDLNRFFAICRNLLVDGGKMVINEQHPICAVLFDEDKSVEYAPVIQGSYFTEEPYFGADSLDYYVGTEYNAPEYHWYHHRLDQIITSALVAGFAIETFRESPQDIANSFEHYASLPCKLPLSYLLTLNC